MRSVNVWLVVLGACLVLGGQAWGLERASQEDLSADVAGSATVWQGRLAQGVIAWPVAIEHDGCNATADGACKDFVSDDPEYDDYFGKKEFGIKYTTKWFCNGKTVVCARVEVWQRDDCTGTKLTRYRTTSAWKGTKYDSTKHTKL